MPSEHTTTKKRASAGSSSANKRARGTASQPILINSQPQLPAAPPSPSSLPIMNTLQALTSAPHLSFWQQYNVRGDGEELGLAATIRWTRRCSPTSSLTLGTWWIHGTTAEKLNPRNPIQLS
ncbi:hypothetical protein BDW02DRAFT_379434 [Decorospora gaudefroyi]|uniref:Uncharacterized protein n=1 Tax=Decorospora gaudefroyi TaxID=184978 RepID=A0A6A5K6R0_9PLEO|nr:hypothetical protein BDW02DRAFT_379434 [Decorospora gaudefroyi]